MFIRTVILLRQLALRTQVYHLLREVARSFLSPKVALWTKVLRLGVGEGYLIAKSAIEQGRLPAGGRDWKGRQSSHVVLRC